MTIIEKHDIEIERYISRIIRLTAKHTGAGVNEIDDAKTRRKALDVFARTVAMAATMQFVGLTKRATARRFGYADHSTVAYLLKRFRADGDIAAKVEAVCDKANVRDTLFSAA